MCSVNQKNQPTKQPTETFKSCSSIEDSASSPLFPRFLRTASHALPRHTPLTPQIVGYRCMKIESTKLVRDLTDSCLRSIIINPAFIFI